MAIGLKIWKYEEKLHYLCSENKGAELICVFVLAHAKSRFSHDEAHMCMDTTAIFWTHLNKYEQLNSVNKVCFAVKSFFCYLIIML